MDLMPLYITAATLGFMHTVFGPDHYVPFIVIAKARNWSLLKTVTLTFFCGIGHVLSSVIIGAVGIFFGISVMKLEILENFRGNIAGWILIVFGFTYLIWGLYRAIKNKPHKHYHGHLDTTQHAHTHSHEANHVHVHESKVSLEKFNITPWVLFIIFVFGPCEPLIPILMYPAAKNSMIGVVWVAIIFSVTTISTMLTIVTASYLGINFIPLRKLERYTHALAGGAVLFCGIAVRFLGL